MKLDYGTQMSPYSIPLSVGNLRKPKLKDIANHYSHYKMSFEKFYFYEFLITMTPEEFFTQVDLNYGKELWDSLSKEEKQEITLYSLIKDNSTLSQLFLEIFNFFFEETVLYVNSVFVFVNPNKDYKTETPHREDIVGIVDSNNFSEILNIIQQVCCIAPEEKEIPKFKNKIAKKIYYQIQEDEEEKAKKKGIDKDMTLPNIISKVSANHHSINYINIWEYTIFELLDNFASLREEKIYDIEKTSAAVWGDEKKTFDPSKWYKNEFDRK